MVYGLRGGQSFQVSPRFILQIIMCSCVPLDNILVPAIQSRLLTAKTGSNEPTISRVLSTTVPPNLSIHTSAPVNYIHLSYFHYSTLTKWSVYKRNNYVCTRWHTWTGFASYNNQLEPISDKWQNFFTKNTKHPIMNFQYCTKLETSIWPSQIRFGTEISSVLYLDHKITHHHQPPLVCRCRKLRVGH